MRRAVVVVEFIELVELEPAPCKRERFLSSGLTVFYRMLAWLYLLAES
jgi:hypothetical protein